MTLFCCLLGWVALSNAGWIASRRAPWALYTTTLWLDKCCVLQDTPETISAGVAGFSRFLGNCNGMIAFVSASYFQRLWCVYELATFCNGRDKFIRDQLAAAEASTDDEKKGQQKAQAEKMTIQDSLLLLSLTWPNPLSPFKTPELNKRERAWFDTFTCLQVRPSRRRPSRRRPSRRRPSRRRPSRRPRLPGSKGSNPRAATSRIGRPLA